MKVLAVNALDGNNGIVDRPERFTPEEKETIEKMKHGLEFTVEGVHCMGWCRTCNRPIREIEGYNYNVNQNGFGTITVDVYHKYCD